MIKLCNGTQIHSIHSKGKTIFCHANCKYGLLLLEKRRKEASNQEYIEKVVKNLLRSLDEFADLAESIHGEKAIVGDLARLVDHECGANKLNSMSVN